MLLVAFFVAIAIGIVGSTIASTRWAYPALPESVPMGFSLDGTPRTYLPRLWIWLLPAIQSFVALTTMWGASLPPGPGKHAASLLGASIFVCALCAFTWRLQLQILKASQTPGWHMPVARELPVLFGVLGLGVLALLTL